jgi:hypothetical protein
MIFKLEVEIGRPFLEQMEQLGIPQKRFSGDASLIELRHVPPCSLLFEAGNFFTKLSSANCSHIAGGPAADDNQVVFHKEMTNASNFECVGKSTKVHRQFVCRLGSDGLSPKIAIRVASVSGSPETSSIPRETALRRRRPPPGDRSSSVPSAMVSLSFGILMAIGIEAKG